MRTAGFLSHWDGCIAAEIYRSQEALSAVQQEIRTTVRDARYNETTIAYCVRSERHNHTDTHRDMPLNASKSIPQMPFSSPNCLITKIPVSSYLLPIFYILPLLSISEIILLYTRNSLKSFSHPNVRLGRKFHFRLVYICSFNYTAIILGTEQIVLITKPNIF